MSDLLRVKGWRDHQHYKARKQPPPWIKLYRRTLTDYDFVQLNEADRFKLIGLWLLASDKDGTIPNDARYLAKCLDVKRLDLDSFIARGFLERVYTESRQSLEPVYSHTEPEEETEKEAEPEAADFHLARLLRALTDRDEGTERVIRSFNPSTADLEEAREAAMSSTADSPTRVAISVLKRRTAAA